MTTTDAPQAPPAFGPHYLTEDQQRKLLEAIHPGRVAVLDGLSHLEAYDVRAQLTRIFGFGRWGEKIIDKTLLYAEPTQTRNGKEAVKVAYDVTVRLSVRAPDGTELAEFDGAAVGESIMPTFKQGDAYDMALKTACSQALKRAAIDLGDQFGLSLYRNGSKDALIRKVFAGMPGEVAAVHEPEPDVAPEPRPADEIAADQLAPGETVDTATGEVRTADRQARAKPAVQAAAPAAAAGKAKKPPTPEEIAQHITAAVDEVALALIDKRLAELGMAETEVGEYTLGQLVQGKRDALADAAKAAKGKGPKPSPDAVAAAWEGVRGTGEPETPAAPVSAIVKSSTPDQADECKTGGARTSVLQSLSQMGVDDAAIATAFGRPQPQVSTHNLIALTRETIAARQAAEKAARAATRRSA